MANTTLRLDAKAQESLSALMQHFGEKSMNGAINEAIKGYLNLNKSYEEKQERIRALESDYAHVRSLLLQKIQVAREIEEWEKSIKSA